MIITNENKVSVVVSDEPKIYSVEEMLDIIKNNHRVEFYLTGSRFFGTENANSDHDLFVKDCPEIRLYLHYYGFVIDSRSGYENTNLTYVYKYTDIDGKIIHIQMIKDVDLHSGIQKYIYKYGIYVGKSHDQMKEVWRDLYQIAKF
jgi:hypothetical protein